MLFGCRDRIGPKGCLTIRKGISRDSKSTNVWRDPWDPRELLSACCPSSLCIKDVPKEFDAAAKAAKDTSLVCIRTDLFAVEADCWNMLKSHWQSIMCPMSTMSRITALESLDCFQSWNILKLWSVLNKFEHDVNWLLLALSRSIWSLSFDYRWTSGVSERLRAQSSSSFCAPNQATRKVSAQLDILHLRQLCVFTVLICFKDCLKEFKDFQWGKTSKKSVTACPLNIPEHGQVAGMFHFTVEDSEVGWHWLLQLLRLQVLSEERPSFSTATRRDL